MMQTKPFTEALPIPGFMARLWPKIEILRMQAVMFVFILPWDARNANARCFYVYSVGEVVERGGGTAVLVCSGIKADVSISNNMRTEATVTHHIYNM